MASFITMELHGTGFVEEVVTMAAMTRDVALTPTSASFPCELTCALSASRQSQGKRTPLNAHPSIQVEGRTLDV